MLKNPCKKSKRQFSLKRFAKRRAVPFGQTDGQKGTMKQAAAFRSYFAKVSKRY
jgi:hypothetical protein